MKEQSYILNNQAILLASDGKYSEAIAFFKKAISLEQNNYILWYNLGITYSDAGKLEEAKNSLSVALKLSPENSEVQEALASIYLMQKEFHNVHRICDRGLDFNPYNLNLWNLKGICEFQEENYENALLYFEYVISLNPYYLDALYNLKDTYSVMKNKNGEAECNKKIHELKKMR